jgi:hypothetical protein
MEGASLGYERMEKPIRKCFFRQGKLLQLFAYSGAFFLLVLAVFANLWPYDLYPMLSGFDSRKRYL